MGTYTTVEQGTIKFENALPLDQNNDLETIISTIPSYYGATLHTDKITFNFYDIKAYYFDDQLEEIVSEITSRGIDIQYIDITASHDNNTITEYDYTDGKIISTINHLDSTHPDYDEDHE